MADANALESLLNAGNWMAVEMAAKQGAAALPVVRRAAGHAKFQTRQIAMASAGKIGGAEAGKILGAGLSDADLNVRLQAANELSVNPPAEAGQAILARLPIEEDDRVKEPLALAAGYIPGDQTVRILQLVAGMWSGELAKTARMALAKVGDKPSREALLAELSSPDAFVRYTAVGWLRYVDDKQYVPHARKLLHDKAPAQKIGPVRQPKFRRVCDQAVDTLVHLLKLKVPFETDLEKIYSDTEINTIAKLVP